MNRYNKTNVPFLSYDAPTVSDKFMEAVDEYLDAHGHVRMSQGTEERNGRTRGVKRLEVDGAQ